MADEIQEINLPYNWKPWEHQMDAWEAMMKRDVKRAVWVWHRRSGKDQTALNILCCKAMERVGVYWYVFPEYKQGREIFWDGQRDDGVKFRDAMPQALIKRSRDDTMFMELINGSIIKVIGSDRADSIVGPNPVGVIFSEFSIQNPKAWNLIRPILNANNGWAIFVYTPRGYNHGHMLFEAAKKQMKKDPNRWHAQLLTIDQTQKMLIDNQGKFILDDDEEPVWGPIVTQAMIQEDLETGLQPELVQQEYYCSFDAAMVGSYYGDQMAAAVKQERIKEVNWDEHLNVHTAWDIGRSDATAIWFFQIINDKYKMINYLEFTGKSFGDIIKEVKELPYIYGSHLGPHDLKVTDFTAKESRWMYARNLGINFIIVAKLSIQDGIDAARRLIPKTEFDKESCSQGIACLQQYQKKFDEVRKVFSDTPLHNWCSHGADAFRMLSVGREYIRETTVDNFNQAGVAGHDYNVFSHESEVDSRYIAGSEYDLF